MNNIRYPNIYLIEFYEHSMLTFGEKNKNPIKIVLQNGTTLYLSSILFLNKILQKIIKINYILNYKKNFFTNNKFELNIVQPFDINNIFYDLAEITNNLSN